MAAPSPPRPPSGLSAPGGRVLGQLALAAHLGRIPASGKAAGLRPSELERRRMQRRQGALLSALVPAAEHADGPAEPAAGAAG